MTRRVTAASITHVGGPYVFIPFSLFNFHRRLTTYSSAWEGRITLDPTISALRLAATVSTRERSSSAAKGRVPPELYVFILAQIGRAHV